jgi:WD40 repeat protein
MTVRMESLLRFASAFLCSAVLANAAAYLEPNRGQAAVDVAFLARTPAGTLSAGPASMGLLRGDGSSAAIVFEGASTDAHANPELPLPGVSHYARGRDSTDWIWDVPHYGAVRYERVYPGIDLVYRISQGSMEFDFVLAAGADPSRIRLRVPADFSIDGSGALAGNGTVLRPAAAWQNIHGKRVPVGVRFAADNGHRVHFRLGDYDRSVPVTIDPVVQTATFLGGSGNEIGMRVLAGSDEAIYTAGNTTSADFPASLSPDNPLNRPGALLEQTAYLARLKPDLSALDWSLFIGGSARQAIFALKRDNFGNLYLLGGTTSPNFPVTSGAWRTTIDPSLTDMFLVKLDAQTGHIKTGTFLGIALYTNRIDAGAQLTIDAAGGIYIGGYRLLGGSFTPTPGALQTTTPESYFVMRLNTAMNAVVYATYWTIGSISALEVDGAGTLWIAGATAGNVQGYTPVFPALNPLPGVNQSPSWPNQAYIARLNPTGDALISATMLHGDGNGSGIGDLKVSPDGSIYLSGWTGGSKFPQVQPLAIDPLPTGYPAQQDGYTASPFLAKLAADARSLLQSTLFYGPSYTPSAGQALNTNLRMVLQPNGAPCLLGLKVSPAQQTAGGMIGTAALTAGYGYYESLNCVDSAGVTLGLRTGLPLTGGSYTDVAAAPDGSLLLTGSATATFTTTPGVVQAKYGGNPTYTDYYATNAIAQGDAFVMRLSLNNPAPNTLRVYPDSLVLDTATSGPCAAFLLGSGFASGASVTLNGQSTTYSFMDASHATVSFNCGELHAGDNHLIVTLPPPGGGTSDRILTGINNPPYTVSVSPASVTQGAAETKVVIRATNLTAGSTLYWNGAPRAALFVLDGAPGTTGHFELLLEPPELVQPASVTVTVSNPAPGGGISPPAVFAVQPASAPSVPVLFAPPPFLYSGSGTPSGQVSISGSGFTSSTRAFWDGAEMPVISATSARITVQPPAADLIRIGAHDIYAANGTFASPPVRLFVGRALTASTSAYDPNRKLLYAISAAAFNNPVSDLLIFDATTGNLLSTVAGIGSSIQVVVLSADGRYLYIGANAGSLGTVLRYSAAAGVVDLQWTVPPAFGHPTVGITSLVTPPDSPETLIVSTDSGQVLVYDRDQPRLYDSISAGFPTNYFGGGYPLVFASSSRVYGGGGPSPVNANACWVWLDYDAFGISGAQPACGDEPPEMQHDSGVTYLTDGTRVYVTSLPWPLLRSNTAPSFALDLTRRQAWQLNVTSGGEQLVEYGLDAQTLHSRALFGASASGAAGRVYPMDTGAVLLVSPSYMLLIP